MNRVAVVGNTHWQNKRKVQDTLQMLKKKFGDELIVVGAGGNEGANSMVRKYALCTNHHDPNGKENRKLLESMLRLVYGHYPKGVKFLKEKV